MGKDRTKYSRNLLRDRNTFDPECFGGKVVFRFDQIPLYFEIGFLQNIFFLPNGQQQQQKRFSLGNSSLKVSDFKPFLFFPFHLEIDILSFIRSLSSLDENLVNQTAWVISDGLYGRDKIIDCYQPIKPGIVVLKFCVNFILQVKDWYDTTLTMHASKRGEGPSVY